LVFILSKSQGTIRRKSLGSEGSVTWAVQVSQSVALAAVVMILAIAGWNNIKQENLLTAIISFAILFGGASLAIMLRMTISLIKHYRKEARKQASAANSSR
jgi:hypothetical protein